MVEVTLRQTYIIFILHKHVPITSCFSSYVLFHRSWRPIRGGSAPSSGGTVGFPSLSIGCKCRTKSILDVLDPRLINFIWALSKDIGIILKRMTTLKVSQKLAFMKYSRQRRNESFYKFFWRISEEISWLQSKKKKITKRHHYDLLIN